MEVLKTDFNSNNQPSPSEICGDTLTGSPESDSQPKCSSTELTELGSCSDEEALSTHNNWGLSLEELFDMSLTFMREKDGKAFHPTYEEKLRLVALQKQATQGPYNPSSFPDVGFFDVLGNDRRKEWASLGSMAKEEAMSAFIEHLHTCCHLFAPYMTSHQIEREERDRRRKEEERLQLEKEEKERRRVEEQQRQEEERQKENEKWKREEDERLRVEQQKQQIMAALNAQTSVQFQQYAAQQCPSDPDQQRLLIQQLQEQHYQQYIQQALQLQMAQQQQDPVEKQQTEATSVPQDSGDQGDVSLACNHESATDQPDSSSQSQEEIASTLPPTILTPSMWTRPQIKDFKQKMHDDADSVISVGRGEVVTVRVPTNEDGSYMFWEFATDHYDIGFGLFFEWTQLSPPETCISTMKEAGDEEILEGKAHEETTRIAVQEEIVPVCRRDSHMEVYAGSHQYPGQGTYLLKFDNSYSLWRSKVVYYRVYYTR